MDVTSLAALVMHFQVFERARTHVVEGDGVGDDCACAALLAAAGEVIGVTGGASGHQRESAGTRLR